MTDRRTWSVIALVAVLCIAGCGKRKADDEESSGGATAIPEVTVTKVSKATLATPLVVNGNLTGPPNRDAKVAALVPGRVARVAVVEGDAVKEGQILAELESSQLKDQVRQAEAAAAQAQANVENARISAERNQGLLQRGIAARKEVDDARTQLAVNEAAFRQAEAALSVARTQLSRAEIRAPFAGTVVRRFLGVGDQVDGTAAQPVVEVANVETLELLGTAPAARLNSIKTGQDFEFQSDVAPGRSFKASIVAVLPAVDPGTNNGTVRIRIANPKHLLKVGQYLSITLPVKARGEGLVVPKQAIYPDEAGEPHVYRVKGDEAEAIAVELGVETNDRAEILSGVKEGDTVILAGGYGLPEKAKVRVKQ